MISLDSRLAQGFDQAFGGRPDIVVRAPARVNLIGEHTDYNDGFAMPMAIGEETRVAFRSGGSVLRVKATDFDEDDSFDPSFHPDRLAGWRNYVRGVTDQLIRAGVTIPCGELAIAGSIAKGTGLSSSASLEVALAKTLLTAAGLDWDPLQIALLSQRAEYDFVGVRCGNLDQIAAAATTKDHAILIDCRSLELHQIPMMDKAVVMIVQSGVVRGLLGGTYNQRREECELAARTLGVAALRDADETMLEAARGKLDKTAYRRARHVISDNQRTLAMAEAMARSDISKIGILMRESHKSQRDDFAITVPHTDAIADLINNILGGDGGARQTGGGFGGAVVALMPECRVEDVRQAVLVNYTTPSGSMPAISVERAQAGVEVL